MNSKFLQILPSLILIFISHEVVCADIRYFNFTIQYTNVTRLCHTKSLVSVNGEFPGPTNYVTEGDTVVVNVTNLVDYDVTIHWHGVRQLLSGWADGPAYITQCPIQTNQSYVHIFQIVGQRGTMLWHAHFSWLRATVYGAFIVLKQHETLYPFAEPDEDFAPIILGEWWNANVEDIIAEALASGEGYNVSDAITINGQPGDLYNCSANDTVVYDVTQGETVLLRIINAAVNFHMFFAVANHTLTVVEADGAYTQLFTTDVILLAPGQTTNVLLTANNSISQYFMAASIYSPANLSYPATPTTAILSYNGSSPSSNMRLPTFPAVNDTAFQNYFTQSLKGRKFSEGFYDMDLPETVDVDLLHTVGYAVQPCADGGLTCEDYGNTSYVRASISNITFVTPNISLLQAYYEHISGTYTTDFPDFPLYQYNYTGVDPEDKVSLPGIRVRVLPFNSNVQIVYQNTATLFFETHPIHIHGQSFYVVGTGQGNYNSSTDPANFNLVNPLLRNTISVPYGGWAAVRFRAKNPGVWFVHCHLDIHQSWGMDMAFITLNGVGDNQTLPSPPADLPTCATISGATDTAVDGSLFAQ